VTAICLVVLMKVRYRPRVLDVLGLPHAMIQQLVAGMLLWVVEVVGNVAMEKVVLMERMGAEAKAT